jgi:PAS domain S-box-containing protein
MPPPLKVLILEDRADDAKLLLHELRRAGFEPQARCVDNETDFAAALDPALDVILADYGVPGWSGTGALAMVQDSKFEIPVIIVSGAIGDERAAAIMQQGAADFLLKDRMGRLGASVRQVLGQRRLQRDHRAAEVALQVAHSRLSHLLAHNPAVLFEISVGDNLLVPRITSGSILELLGFTVAETATQDWWLKRLHPDDRLHAAAAADGAFAVNSSRTEYRMRHKAGHDCWVDDSRRLVRDMTGAPTTLVGVWIDITERKRAEAERAKLATELQASQAEVKVLSGLLPICASCKRIRDEQDRWQPLETYIQNRSEAHFTHGLCPQCVGTLYPGVEAELASAASARPHLQTTRGD